MTSTEMATGTTSVEFEAVSLDVGGVLVVPDHGILANVLGRCEVPFDRSRFADGHYHGMVEVERARSEPETFGDYAHGFLRAVGVPAAQLEVAAAAMGEVMALPLWCQRIPGAVQAARRLRDLGLRLALTSNADGTVEDLLRRHEIAQVGPGPGVEVEAVTDSGVLGVHKPDPKMFQATADALGLAPDRICHIGDGGSFDADGASSFGMTAVHIDPLGMCTRPHDHVLSLAAFAERVAQRVEQ